MPNQTTVTLVNGVPTAPSGTVSTIDALMADGGQATIGAKADAKNSATDTTAVSGISIWKQISASVQAIAASIAGTVAVSGTFFQATQPVSAASLPLPTGAMGATGGTVGLVAGTAIIGKVGIDQTTPGTTDSISVKGSGFSSALSITRTADTNAYTANDVIGTGTGAAGASLTFANAVGGAGEYMISSVALEIDAAAIISGETSYRLYLYNITPPSALGDNAAWDLPSGDRASFLGYVDLGTPADLGSTLYVETNQINKQIKAAGTSLFGYLVTNGAYTPTSARVHVVTIHTAAI